MSAVLLQLGIVTASLLGLLGAINAIKTAGTAFGWLPEVQRKAVHVSTGLYALGLPFLFQDRWPVILLVLSALAVMLVLRLPRVATAGIGSAVHGVERKSYGDMLLALAVGFVFLRSRDNLILYTLPIAVITLSDAAAALAGSTYGRRIYHVEEGTKSAEGAAVFFMVTWIVAMVMLLLFTDVPRVNVVVIGLTLGVFGALVEAYSWRGFDNLFVPISVHLYLQGYLYSPPLEIAVLAAGFFATILGLVAFAPVLGITGHAARAYAVALFLLIGVSGALAAVLPSLAVLAHLYARTHKPCRSRFPDLDLLAMVAGAGLVWLTVGESLGPSATNFFGLTFAGSVVVYAVIASDQRIPIAAGTAAALFAVHWAVVSLSAPAKQWHGDLLPLAAASLLLCAAVGCLRPHWFDRWRAPRVIGIATVLPLASYLSKVLL